MYNDYFRFKQKPFSIAPDPGFLYLSDRHREALAHLMYGLTTDGGFVLITGEVGTGKTTLIRSLIDRLPSDLDVAFILNPRLTVQELLETLCDELGVPYQREQSRTVKHYLDGLNKHLLKTHSLGRSTVLIIDEAQNLAPPVLEQIRLLTNLETNERKLLRIILLGQPELADMLDRKELRQLAQRITARYHLASLNSAETRSYITHRLTLAGGSPLLFSRAASTSVHRLARGIPRLINVIADRALLGTFVEGKQRVSPAVVRKAAREVSGQRAKPRFWLGAVATTLLVAIGAAFLWLDRGDPKEAVASSQPAAPPVESTDATQRDAASPNAETAPVESPQSPELVAKADVEPPSTAIAEPLPMNVPSEPARDVPQAAVAIATLPAALSRPPDLTGAESQRLAYAALFERWNQPFDSDDIPCNHAPLVGLQCLKQQGSWTDVVRLDRPVVVELWDSRADPYYAAVLNTSGSQLKMRVGHQEVESSAAELDAAWYGTFIVLWEMPPNYRGNLQLGDQDPGVVWLRQRLSAALGREVGAAADSRFDQTLYDALVEYQRGRGLAPDGVAGPYTWIHLGSGLGGANPTLASAG